MIFDLQRFAIYKIIKNDSIPAGTATLEPVSYFAISGKTVSIYNKDFKGATASSNGERGMVPAPVISDKDKFLKGDGTWQAVSGSGQGSVSYSNATTITAGLMSAEDKIKLDQISQVGDINVIEDIKLNGTSLPVTNKSVDINITAPQISSFTGATGASSGTNGLVPAPEAGDESKFLRGDGTWATVSSVAASILLNVPTQNGSLTYNGTEQSPAWSNYDPAQLLIGGVTEATDAGTYTATFTPQGLCTWTDGTANAKSVTWTVAKAALNLSASIDGTVAFSETGTITVSGNAGGGTITATSDNTSSVIVQNKTTSSVTVKCVGVSSTAATITVSVPETANYLAASTTCAVATKKVTLSVPSVTGTNFTFDGSSHVPTIATYNTALITVTGNTAQTNAGSYEVVFVLSNTANSQWSDNSVANKNVTWAINKADCTLTLSGSLGTVTYGTPSTFTVTNNTSGGKLSVSSADTTYATASISGNTVTVNCAQYRSATTAITVTSAETANYNAATATFTMIAAKAAGSVTLSATSGTVTYGTPKTFTVTNNTSGGALSASSSNSAYVGASLSGTTVTVNVVEVNSATRTITVTSAETDNYTAATATYTVTSVKAVGSVTLSSTSGTVTYGTPGSFTVTGNTSGGELSVSSSNSTYVGASLSGNTVTVTVNEVNSATRTITVTSAATTNYNAATATYTVTSAKAAGNVTLNATMGTVTYGFPSSLKVTKNTSGGALSVESAASEYVSATISDTTVTVTTNKYSSSKVDITVTSAATTNYTAATATFKAITRRATSTLSIDKTSLSLTVNAPSDTVTVTTNSNGTITATPADSSVCSASVNDNMVTIEGKSNGETTVTIAVSESDQYTATSETVTITASILPINMTENTTLEEIKTIFSSGQGANYFKAGDYFDITFPSEITLASGSIAANSTWRVVCLGIDHNSSVEGKKRGHFCIGKTTTGKDICFCNHRMNSSNTNSGGWNGSAIKTWLNETFYNALPTDLQNVITECTKYTDNTGGNTLSNSEDDVTSTSQKIWFMAEFEVLGTTSESTHTNQYEQNKQAQYDYYKNGNAKIRYQHNWQSQGSGWFTRSPYYAYGQYGFRYVSTSGTSIGTPSDTPYGIVPCFTIS